MIRRASDPAGAVGCVLAVGVLLLGLSPARAAVVEPARVRVSAGLIDEVVARLMPLDVVLPVQPGSGPDAGSDGSPQAALITELRYCGVTDKGTGRFRAVLRWGILGSAPAVLAGADGCRQSLGELAKHARAAEMPASDSGVTIADLEASWRPWELKLSITRALMPAAPSPPRPGPPRPLAPVEIKRDLLTLHTAGLRIPTDAGEAITVHAAPAFVADGIDVAVVVGDAGAGSSPPASRPAPTGGALPFSADANLALDLPYGTANQLLRQLSGTQPIVIPVDRDVIDLQNLSIAPGTAAGAATVAGTATPRSLRETVRLTVAVAGADLKVMSLRADAQLENCGSLGALAAIACNARNAARNAAAGAFAAAASQKYQGRLVRELGSPQVLSVDVAMRRLELRGDLTRATMGPRGLMVWGRLGSSGGAGGGGTGH